MDLQELKRRINEAGFSPEVLAKLNELVDGAVAKGGLDAATKQLMTDLVDLDIEAGVLEADTMEKMALAFDSLADETERAVQMADQAEADLEAEVEEKVSKVEAAAKSRQSESTPPVAPTM